MARIKRKHKLRYYTINIKLRSNKRSGRDAYVEIMEELHKRRIIKKTGGDHAMIFRTMHRNYIGNDFMLTGLLTRFVSVEGDDWVNIQNFEIEKPEIPKNYFPNPKEVMYYFVPSAHRFALKVDQSFSLNVVADFLKQALLEIIERDEQIEVIVEQTSDVFEKILNAKSVRKLTITISYTNADITQGAEKWLDDLLTESQIGDLTLEVKSDQNDNILVNENVIIEGALALAQNNGTVVANIVDSEDDKRKTIKTSLHPKPDEVEETLQDNLLPGLYNKIMEKYRRNAEDT